MCFAAGHEGDRKRHRRAEPLGDVTHRAELSPRGGTPQHGPPVDVPVVDVGAFREQLLAALTWSSIALD